MMLMQEFQIQMVPDILIILFTLPLKYLVNFWRALNIPLISCEISLELKWDKNCIITSLEQRDIGDIEVIEIMLQQVQHLV